MLLTENKTTNPRKSVSRGQAAVPAAAHRPWGPHHRGERVYGRKGSDRSREQQLFSQVYPWTWQATPWAPRPAQGLHLDHKNRYVIWPETSFCGEDNSAALLTWGRHKAACADTTLAPVTSPILSPTSAMTGCRWHASEFPTDGWGAAQLLGSSTAAESPQHCHGLSFRSHLYQEMRPETPSQRWRHHPALAHERRGKPPYIQAWTPMLRAPTLPPAATAWWWEPSLAAGERGRICTRNPNTCSSGLWVPRPHHQIRHMRSCSRRAQPPRSLRPVRRGRRGWCHSDTQVYHLTCHPEQGDQWRATLATWDGDVGPHTQVPSLLRRAHNLSTPDSQ